MINFKVKYFKLDRTVGLMTVIDKAIIDITLRPRCTICCHCIRRQSPSVWRSLANLLEILTACFSTTPTSLLPTPRAMWTIMWQMMSSQNREYITCCTGNMYRKFREVWTCRFSYMRADRQTYRHAHRSTSHLYRKRSNCACKRLTRVCIAIMQHVAATQNDVSCLQYTRKCFFV